MGLARGGGKKAKEEGPLNPNQPSGPVALGSGWFPVLPRSNVGLGFSFRK